MSVTEGLKRGTIEIMILAMLKDEDLYGYLLCQRIEEKSHGLFRSQEGPLYPPLYRLLEKGYISSRTETVGIRRKRIYYHIEEAGIKYLDELKNEYLSFNQGVLFALGYGDLRDFLDEK